MRLYEYEGKELFRKYGIPVPEGITVKDAESAIDLEPPFAIKAQVLSGDRQKAGGILFASTLKEAKTKIKKILGHEINEERVTRILVEKKIPSLAEYYCSISYGTETRSPVLALSKKGGTGIAKASITPMDILHDAPPFYLREAVSEAGFPSEDINGMAQILRALWKLFTEEYALLAEINPLIKTAPGKFAAADAKIILDDEKVNPGERRFIEMDGDIAILASGGGASLLNIDALLFHNGRPANYTEYSGNPPAQVVADLTRKVLSKRGLKGCWVIGGTANFTDIFETMRGFVDGLRAVRPKPRYPFVIRRDGPRQKEAVEMLKSVARKEGYDFHIYGSETPMAETAGIMVRLAYNKKILNSKF